MGTSKGLMIGLAIAFMVLPIVAVILRVSAKAMKSARLTADDWLVFPALIFTEAIGICQLVVAFRGNAGQHLTYTHSPEIPDQINALIVFLKVEYAFELFAQLAILFAKLSLIFLYRRIFVGYIFKRVSWAIVALIVCWHGAFIIAFLAQCVPVKAIWDFTVVNPKCVNRNAMWEAYAISDVLTDALVLSMPIGPIIKLQMPLKHKLGVLMIFTLGAVVIGTGIARTVVFFHIAGEPTAISDITYAAAPAMYWSLIETSLATVCACLPTLRPLVASSGVGSVVGKFRSYIRSGSSQSNLNSSMQKASLESGDSQTGLGTKERYPHQSIHSSYSAHVTAGDSD